MDIKLLNQRQTGFRVKAGRRQEFFADGLTEFINVFVTLEALMIKNDLADQ